MGTEESNAVVRRLLHEVIAGGDLDPGDEVGFACPTLSIAG